MLAVVRMGKNIGGLHNKRRTCAAVEELLVFRLASN